MAGKQQGQRVPRQHSAAARTNLNNITDPMPGQTEWSVDNLPDILYVFRPTAPQVRTIKDRIPTKPSPWGKGEELRVLDILPDRISTNVEEFRVEAWMRLDRRIQLHDITDRMNPEFRVNNNALQQRSVRFRQAFYMLSWGSGNKQTKVVAEELEKKMIEVGIDPAANSTRGMTPGLIDPALGVEGGVIEPPEAYARRYRTYAKEQQEILEQLATMEWPMVDQPPMQQVGLSNAETGSRPLRNSTTVRYAYGSDYGAADDEPSSLASSDGSESVFDDVSSQHHGAQARAPQIETSPENDLAKDDDTYNDERTGALVEGLMADVSGSDVEGSEPCTEENSTEFEYYDSEMTDADSDEHDQSGDDEEEMNLDHYPGIPYYGAPTYWKDEPKTPVLCPPSPVPIEDLMAKYIDIPYRWYEKMAQLLNSKDFVMPQLQEGSPFPMTWTGDNWELVPGIPDPFRQVLDWSETRDTPTEYMNMASTLGCQLKDELDAEYCRELRNWYDMDLR
ncbi:hypothetical protein FQN53_005389 [Emmonsiellopsis sp. PD_33]|nr:hypothetical protein FQN53_005389 [Emmonsiellopsis sp. PD_33]